MRHHDEDPKRDARWLAEIAAGGSAGRQAMRGLTQAYDRSFQGFLVRRGLRVHDIEDVLQAHWLRVAERASTFDPERGHAGAWLWRIFRGEAADFFRQQDDGLVDYGLEDDDELPGDASLRPDARDEMLLRCIRRAMARLRRREPDGAQLLWMREAQDIKPEELAARDGRVVGTIKNLLSKVRDVAREVMAPCHEGREQPPLNGPPHAAT